MGQVGVGYRAAYNSVINVDWVNSLKYSWDSAKGYYDGTSEKFL